MEFRKSSSICRVKWIDPLKREDLQELVLYFRAMVKVCPVLSTEYSITVDPRVCRTLQYAKLQPFSRFILNGSKPRKASSHLQSLHHSKAVLDIQRLDKNCNQTR